MKAEHRKELKTNWLADHLGRWWTALRAGTASRTYVSVGIFVVLAIVVVIVWQFLLNRQEFNGQAWFAVETALQPSGGMFAGPDTEKSVKELEEVAGKNKGSIAGRAARYQLARMLLDHGLQDLYSGSEKDRLTQAANVEKARTLYRELAVETSDNPILAQEAMMGTAKAEEALAGVRKEGGTTETRGSLDEALKLYGQLASKYPDSFPGKAAGDRARQLQEKKEQIQNFYAELSKLTPPAKKD